jgi:hypothetical protein
MKEKPNLLVDYLGINNVMVCGVRCVKDEQSFVPKMGEESRNRFSATNIE